MRRSKTLTKIIAGSLVIACLTIPQIAWAKQDEVKSFHLGQKQERKEHKLQKKQENQQFRSTLKGLTPQEKTNAVLEHRETQYGENKAFHQKLHDENMAFLNQKLANNKRLTDEQKTELVNFTNNQFQESSSFRDQQHAENIAYLQQVANDPNMTQAQRKEALKQYFQKQKAENENFRTQQKTENKEFKQQLKPHPQTQPQV